MSFTDLSEGWKRKRTMHWLERLKKKQRFFDRTEAIEALYYLERKGFEGVGLGLTKNKELFLYCSHHESGDLSIAPDIEIDSTPSHREDKGIILVEALIALLPLLGVAV